MPVVVGVVAFPKNSIVGFFRPLRIVQAVRRIKALFAKYTYIHESILTLKPLFCLIVSLKR
jgi:hypothetical protein